MIKEGQLTLLLLGMGTETKVILVAPESHWSVDAYTCISPATLRNKIKYYFD